MNKEQIEFVNDKISELLCEHCIEETKFDKSGWLSKNTILITIKHLCT